MDTQASNLETAPPTAAAFSAKQSFSLSFSILFLLAFVAGCAHCPLCGGEWDATKEALSLQPKPPEMKTISGTISCMERVTILPTFEIRVKLVSLCTAGGEMPPLAEQTLTAFSGFPMAFSFEYDKSKMSDALPYGLVAELLSQGTPLYRTDTQYKIDKNGLTEAVDLVIVRIK